MKGMTLNALSLLVLAGVLGCAARQPTQLVTVPPRIDLAPHQMIGVMEFESGSKGKLAELATRRFVEEARRDQGMLRMVDLGPRRMGQKSWTPASYRAVGVEHDVQTIFMGELSVSDVRPNFSIETVLRSGDITAQVDATLTVQLVETSTGASLWSASARAAKSLGHISVFRGREFVFDAEDPEAAYGVLVDALVEQVTSDFRATWVRR
jgi:hypothetical protein